MYTLLSALNQRLELVENDFRVSRPRDAASFLREVHWSFIKCEAKPRMFGG